MPLKLLGKKSWNVYNAANIERVRRDEAEARAREADEDRRRKETESARRQAILRGEAVPEEDQTAISGPSGSGASSSAAAAGSQRPWAAKKRKRHGEDDTDFEMRLARAEMEPGSLEATGPVKSKSKSGGAASRPIVDGTGHIDLFGEAPQPSGGGRQARGPPTDGALLNMRFADAAGYNGSFEAWYAGGGDKAKRQQAEQEPRQQQQQRPRHPPLPSSVLADPLAAMRQGAAAVRALTQERKRETEERAADMAAMEAEERRQRRERRRERRRRREEKEHDADDGTEGRQSRRRHHRHESDSDSGNSLEDFSLQGGRSSESRRRHRSQDRRADKQSRPDDRHADRHARERSHRR
ncbi:hypothetical protein CMQ_7015 [Grosmannia clavigera kw1407]|uniref:Rhodanese domain-containing protein n=1 Tax=Grosmannia clavigera (strain kw1407 / UAMH 11150) TaxID=655863 RepID=F0X7I8_GROCL|nr:uncharacterized protein CMQ_7015 [Grosmannia clavigera kw1407]EFX06694.1 hypothetical protein CMQ_7015 [Grosmannia clavigera kw1407]